MLGPPMPVRRSGAIGEHTRLWVLVLSSMQDGGNWIVMFIACWTFLRGLAGQAFGSVGSTGGGRLSRCEKI